MARILFVFLLAAPWATSCPGGATCEDKSCADGFGGDLRHQRYSLCVECDAETDSCEHTFVGEDGEAVESCESCLDGCYDCGARLGDRAAIYCTGSI